MQFFPKRNRHLLNRTHFCGNACSFFQSEFTLGRTGITLPKTAPVFPKTARTFPKPQLLFQKPLAVFQRPFALFQKPQLLFPNRTRLSLKCIRIRANSIYFTKIRSHYSQNVFGVPFPDSVCAPPSPGSAHVTSGPEKFYVPPHRTLCRSDRDHAEVL